MLYDTENNSIGSIEYYYSPKYTYESTETKYCEKALDQNTTLLKIPLIIDNPSKRYNKLSFEAEFLVIKRQGLWLVFGQWFLVAAMYVI